MDVNARVIYFHGKNANFQTEFRDKNQIFQHQINKKMWLVKLVFLKQRL